MARESKKEIVKKEVKGEEKEIHNLRDKDKKRHRGLRPGEVL